MEAAATPAASPPAPQLPTPLVADSIAEKGSETKEKVREQNGGKEEEGKKGGGHILNGYAISNRCKLIKQTHKLPVVVREYGERRRRR